MKKVLLLILSLVFLTVPVLAADVPEDLQRALPEQAENLMEKTDYSKAGALGEGISRIVEKAVAQGKKILRERVRGAVLVLLVALLCSVIEGVYHGTGGTEMSGSLNLTPMAGALTITLLTAGSLNSLIGLGAETIDGINSFSSALLPTLAAATAASGAVGTATVQQVTTVFFADLLMHLIDGLLLPMVYLYIGALTAGTMLPGNQLLGIAEALKKVITWILSAALIAFTVYLSVARIIAGSTDSAAVKVAKAAISGVIPVVGNILSEASETVLAGAGVLKNTIGIFGMLAVLATCAYPFLQIGIQYLLYKLVAFLAGIAGTPELCKLIDGLGGAFGLVLGMTGTCALLLLVSILSSVAAVVP